MSKIKETLEILKSYIKKFLIFTFLTCIFIQNAAFSEEQNIYVISYLTNLQNKIKLNWVLPHGQQDKNTVVEFEIDKQGKIVKSTVFKSSGDKNFDDDAIAALSCSSPFGNLPITFGGDTLLVQLTFNQDDFEAKQIAEFSGVKKEEPVIIANDDKDLENADYIYQNDVVKVSTVDKKLENNTNFMPYITYLQSDIESNWYPISFRGERQAIVFFRIAKNGELKKAKLVKSSGDEDFDTEALSSIHISAPFSPLPTEFKGRSIDVMFNFDHNYKEVSFKHKAVKAKKKNNQSDNQEIPVSNATTTTSNDDSAIKITKMWIVDKISWLSNLVLHFYAHGI